MMVPYERFSSTISMMCGGVVATAVVSGAAAFSRVGRPMPPKPIRKSVTAPRTRKGTVDAHARRGVCCPLTVIQSSLDQPLYHMLLN
jgi:hypothetical protein